MPSWKRLDETDSPVIVQASAGARTYAGAPFLRHLIQAAIEQWPHIPRRHAPGPRRVAIRLPALHPARLQFRHDGRFAGRGHEDADEL